MSTTLKDINMMQAKHSKEQLATRSIAVSRNKSTLVERLTKGLNDYAEITCVSKTMVPFPATKTNNVNDRRSSKIDMQSLHH